MFNDYTQPEDFLADDSFLAWHYKTNQEDIAKWDEWIAEEAPREAIVRKAVDLLESLRIGEQQITRPEVDAAEMLLMQSIGSGPGRNPLISRFVWIAAASVFLIGSFFLAKVFFATKPIIKTNYGEIKEQKLPDGTDVKLNANSNVSYAKAWSDGEDREVWLKGEAFFHVTKTPEKSRFIVHTDHFDVIVTGTQFNVVNRNGQSNVMLNEGSVIIRSANGKELKMIPGDFVEFNTNQTQKRIIRNDSLLAWKDRRLVFENTPLNDVVVIIKNHYGVDIKLADNAVGLKTISGMLPNDNLDVLLQSIDATNDFEVVHHGNEIGIKSRQ
ncbi:MAG: FecR domain-containing protein [Bacteroidetes bacterium]|nr:FecR domain-containing protein [Bacteroidota bacterium]